MADGLMQQDAGPARPQENIHFAGRRRLCIKGHQALPVGFARRPLPELFGQIGGGIAAPAQPMAALALNAVTGRHNGHAKAHQGPHVAVNAAIAADDFNRLPVAGQRNRNLGNFRAQGAGKGVHLLQKADFLGKADGLNRIVRRIEFLVGAFRRGGECPPVLAIDLHRAAARLRAAAEISVEWA